MTISAYDLARDIAKERAQVCAGVPVEWIDGNACASSEEADVLPVIERMIAAALKNGGIAP